jgi:hypothetical protein
MMRPILLLGSILFMVAPLAAEDSPPSSGRYQIVPDGEGFVRLDAETGALAHCGKQDGTWKCDAITTDGSDLDRNVDTLAGQVSALTEAVDELTRRLDGIDKSLAEAGIETAETEEPPEPEFDQALNFAERLMQRFFDFVRELKNEEPPQRI